MKSKLQVMWRVVDDSSLYVGTKKQFNQFKKQLGSDDVEFEAFDSSGIVLGMANDETVQTYAFDNMEEVAEFFEPECDEPSDVPVELYIDESEIDNDSGYVYVLIQDDRVVNKGTGVELF